MTQPSGTKRDQCRSTRQDGRQCTSPALSSGYCFAHDPALAEKRKAARVKGGKNRAALVRLHGLVPPRLVSLYDTLEAALGEVHDGKLSHQQASAMAALARAMVACLSAGELEQRMRDIEAKNELEKSYRQN